MVQIELNKVTKRIRKNTVLNEVTARMHDGRIYGLQGVNGSGKTMLMRTIIGLIRPTEGSVSVNGRILGRDMEFPESIGFLLENPAFLGQYSGFENLNMLAGIQRRASAGQIEDSIRAVGLDPADKKKYRKYSLGMKQRLGIAAAIMEEPDIVILDEPTNALDEAGVSLVQDILARQKERGALVILSCHVRQIFKKGEVVAYGKDYNVSKDDCCDGYTIRVLESGIMSREEFFQEYDTADDMGLATHYYMVKVSVGNVSNEHVGEQGVHMGMSMLVGTNYSVILSPDMFRAVNTDMEVASFSLRLGTEMEMWLVFQIIPGNTPEYEHIVEDPPMLQITQYPHQKLIRLQ